MLLIKEKKLHVCYDLLIEKVWVSPKPINYKLLLAKYLFGRLMKESKRIFIRVQHLVQELCPKCNQRKINKVFYKYLNHIH